MTHPRVTQLNFARSEFQRCLQGISDADARQRIDPLNCISWMIGHLANQEHFYWVACAQDEFIAPGLNELVGSGKPASTPPLEEMWTIWRTVTHKADDYLKGLQQDQLQTLLSFRGTTLGEDIGTMLQRNIYHYWFHIGEAHAVRQALGHTDLPQFVGDMSAYTYQPESD